MSAPSPDSPTPPPSGSEGWVAGISHFISARLDLFKLEARDASEVAAKRGLLIGIILICTILVWLLIVAGLIGWISAALQWPWYGTTFGMAGLHLLVAVVAIVLIKKPTPPTFPLTRAELSKDQAWLENLKNDPKSPK